MGKKSTWWRTRAAWNSLMITYHCWRCTRHLKKIAARARDNVTTQMQVLIIVTSLVQIAEKETELMRERAKV